MHISGTLPHSHTRKTKKEMSKIGQKIVLFIEAGFQIEYLIALALDSSFECNKPSSDW